MMATVSEEPFTGALDPQAQSERLEPCVVSTDSGLKESIDACQKINEASGPSFPPTQLSY